MGIHPPSEAALALDRMDLPVGTFVSWVTRNSTGYSPSRGLVEKVTERSYVLRSIIGDKSVVERHQATINERRLRVLRTPEEQAEFEAEQARQREERSAQHAARKVQEAEKERQRKAEQHALACLREAYPDVFAALVADYLRENPA